MAFSAVIALLALIASASGVFLPDLYRDEPLIASVWRSNDLITLVVALPLLVAAIGFAMRGSQRAQIVWMGMIGYTLYNYAFYLYGAAFNRLFLLYVALTALSIYALIFGLVSMDACAISRRFRATTPVRWLGAYMLFFALGLGGVEIAAILSIVVSGNVPADIEKLQVIYATDLTLLIPNFVLGGILLFRRHAWGYIVAAIVNIKAVAYVLVLFTLSVTVMWDALTPLYLALGAGNLAVCVALLVNLQPEEKQQVAQPAGTAMAQ
jgi:hypothetical protein